METISFGVLLDTFFSRTEELIHKARDAGQDVVVKVGNQTIRAIDHARIAYSDILSETIDKVDPLIRQKLDGIKAIIEEAETSAERITLEAGRQAQQIANTFPLSETQPQLTRGPRYVCRLRNDENVTLQFIGNFLHSARPDCKPTLSFGSDGPYHPSKNETQLLEFHIPRATLFPTDLPRSGKGFSYRDGVLRIFWESGWLITQKKSADFHVSIGCLPDSPGTVQLLYTTVVHDIIKREKKAEFHLDSCNHHDGTDGTHTPNWVGGDNDDHIDYPFSAYPTEGWSVSSSPARIDQIWNEKGDFAPPEIHQQDEHSVSIKATTRHKGGWKKSGRLDFRVAFKEQQPVVIRTPHVETIPLPLWGDSHVFTPGPNWEHGWKVTLDGYDGSHHEFAGTDQSYPLLHVTAQAEGYKVESIIPQGDLDSIA